MTKANEESERFSRLVTGLLQVPHSEIKTKLDEEKKRKERMKEAQSRYHRKKAHS
jgi:hypothetical protein